MASGQQKAQKNINEFLTWISTQSHDDFKKSDTEVSLIAVKSPKLLAMANQR